MKQRMLATFLSLCLLLGLLPTVALAVPETEPVTMSVSNPSELEAALTGDQTNVIISIEQDIELTSEISISGERTIKLMGASDNITIKFADNADFTDTDSGNMFYFAADSGISMTIENITIDGNQKGRLFQLDATGDGKRNSLTLNDNAVLQNGYTSANGSAVWLRSGCDFTMNDGAVIQNNTAGKYSGGVMGWSDDMNVVINGGEIKDNNSEYYAGGIVLLGTYHLYLNGGTISGNSCNSSTYGGGVFLDGGNLHLGGTLFGDNVDGNDVDKDFYFNSIQAGKTMVTIEESIASPITICGARITDSLPGHFVGDKFTAAEGYTLKQTDIDQFQFIGFLSDKVLLLNENEAYVANSDAVVQITYNANYAGGPDAVTKQVPSDIPVALISTPFSRTGYIFVGWNTTQNGSGGTSYADGATITVSKDMTLYAQWIELPDDAITMEYGSEKNLPETEGVELSGWTSDNPDVVQIEGDKLKAVGVGETTITANAALARSGETLTVNVTVTPMPITFGSGENENPGGTITYQYTGEQAPPFSQFATFYPATIGDQTVTPNTNSGAITLTEGTDIVFNYDAGGGANDYAYLPVNVTAESNTETGLPVTVKLLNENYRFVTNNNPTPSETITLSVAVTHEGLTESNIQGLGQGALSFTYDGTGKAAVTGLTGISADNISEFTLHFHPWGNTEFNEQHLSGAANTLTDEAVANISPKEPGIYLMIISGKSDNHYTYKSWIFTINKASVTVKADDKTIYVGDAMPEWTYTVSGLASGESLTTLPTFTCSTTSTNTAGTYTITPSGAAVPNTDRYNDAITYQTGTLTILNRSGGSSSSGGSGSSSSNVSGSGDDVSISASGGTVTDAQMESAVKRADKGSTITIKATSSTTVTLPVGGMADAADNDNDVLLDLRYGEVTLTARTIAGLTDGVSSSGKIKVSITSQTSSKDETISDLLDKGAAVFDVSVTVNDVEVHSFDGTLTLTFTVSNLSKITDPHILHILTDGTKEYYAPDSISGNTITVKGVRNLSTFAVIPGSEVPEEQTNPFTDVYESDYYYDAVLWAVANGVTNGTSATTFGPNVTVTRAQMVTFLWRAHGSPEVTGTNPFADVSTSDYYYDAVLWAVDNGVTNGTSATTFSPDMAVTRAQAVTFQWRAAGSPVVSGSSFGDVASDAYYVNAVTWAVANGITNGTSATTFSPDVVVSRAQAVTFLHRELG